MRKAPPTAMPAAPELLPVRQPTGARGIELITESFPGPLHPPEERTVGSQAGLEKSGNIGDLPVSRAYCFGVVDVNDPGFEFPINELPWKDSIVPPLPDTPVTF